NLCSVSAGFFRYIRKLLIQSLQLKIDESSLPLMEIIGSGMILVYLTSNK
ncbi:unnamed protein product, partial [Thlaspi arvense]